MRARLPRSSIHVIALSLFSCGGGTPAGALELDVSYALASSDGCVRVTATPDTGTPASVTHPLTGRPMSGTFTIGVQRGTGWSAGVTLTGTIHADGTCTAPAAGTQTISATFPASGTTKVAMTLP